MPDNRKYEAQDLIERGWQQMSELLDREMPQKRKRRGAAWLLWGIGALVLLAGVSLILLRTDSPEQVTPAEPSGQHHALAPEATAPSTIPGSAVEHDREVDPAGPVDKAASEPARQATADAVARTTAGDERKMESPDAADRSTAASETIRTTTRSEGVTGHDPESRPTSGQLAENMASPDSTSVQPETSPTRADAPPGINAEIPGRSIVIVDEASRLDVTPLTSAMRQIPAFVALDGIERRALALHGLTAIHLNDAISVYGVEAGIALTYDVGRRISLMTGLTYGHYRERGLFRISPNKQFDELASPVDQDTTMGGSPGTGTSVLANTIYDNTVGYDTARILADRYNYLHMPLVVRYQLTPKIGLSLGIKGSRLLSAPSEYAIDQQSSSFTQNLRLDGNGPNNFLYNFGILRKWDVAPLAGVTLQTGRRTELDVHYQHGLVPFIDRMGVIDRSDYHRTLAVALRYRIW
ncbi:MAG: hypothetical protein R3301_03090 [Saprospiraceae bacterium]|nr:hypothetical protein [Saprospiraceae bacterium]